jgi:hypothetical protein
MDVENSLSWTFPDVIPNIIHYVFNIPGNLIFENFENNQYAIRLIL